MATDAPLIGFCDPSSPLQEASDPASHSMMHNPVVVSTGKTGRSRSNAVRFTSKAAADTANILVKANRAPLAEEVVSAQVGMRCIAAGIQGWRKAMEDRHFIALRGGERHLVSCPSGSSSSGPSPSPSQSASPHGSPECSPGRGECLPADYALPHGIDGYVGVYDGHQNCNTSAFCAMQLHELLCTAFVKKGVLAAEPLEEGNESSESAFLLAATSAGHEAFQALDDAHRRDETVQHGGSTVACAVVTRAHIAMYNLGDSKVALLRRDGSVVTFDKDHRPDNNENERVRILSVGGTVDRNRVNGILSVSRAIGDYALKPDAKEVHKNPVIATPDVIVVRRTQLDQYIVVGCDGVWELNPLQQVQDLLAERQGAPIDSDTVVSIVNSSCNPSPPLVEGASLQLGCDNITLAVLQFIGAHLNEKNTS